MSVMMSEVAALASWTTAAAIDPSQERMPTNGGHCRAQEDA